MHEAYAGRLGFEPKSAGLEPAVLPLNDRPRRLRPECRQCWDLSSGGPACGSLRRAQAILRLLVHRQAFTSPCTSNARALGRGVGGDDDRGHVGIIAWMIEFVKQIWRFRARFTQAGSSADGVRRQPRHPTR